MNIKKIYIITDSPIPVGYAPTNRILSYASGFLKNKIDCEIIVFRKTENDSSFRNYQNKGIVGGVRFEYLFKSTRRSKYFIKRRLDNIYGLFKLLMLSLTRFNKGNVIIYYSYYTRYILMLNIIKKFKKYKILKEESENPNVYRPGKNVISWFIFKRIHYRLFDGFLLMTEKLISYFKENYSDTPVAHIPMTVDIDRFQQKKTNPEKRIAYVGSLNDNKDGIFILLEAFKNVQREIDDYYLLICGYFSSLAQKKKIQKYISDNEIENKVIFKQNVSNLEIPKILINSKFLILPRPNSLQAQHGFPTKLGEYLATGNPVIVTDVGEITHYLQDNITAYISQPGNVNSLKFKILEAIRNENRSKEIGKKGREVAEIYFNNKVQTRRIIEFIYTL